MTSTMEETTPFEPETWTTFERNVSIEETTVTKRELREDELIHRDSGAILRPFWAKERLKNEAATLDFIAKHTNIPVPKCKLFTKDGLLHLETERITGGVLLMDAPHAIDTVAQQVTDVILPQLQSFRRNFIGSVDETIPVFPPQRVYGRCRRAWERISSSTDSFVLCHNDLAPQNIIIHPDSFQILGIIDWEFAGYYPAYYELPLWRAVTYDEKGAVYAEAAARELDFFGLRGEDLSDDVER